MRPISFKYYRFLFDLIYCAVRLQFRFTKSFRDVEDMLGERGTDISYETMLCRVLKLDGRGRRSLIARASYIISL